MDETVAQSMTVARTIIVALDREARDQRMINRVLVVAVVTATVLTAVNGDWEAVNVDRASHHGVAFVSARASQVTMCPVEETVANRITVVRRRR